MSTLFSDHLGRGVQLPNWPPGRIVSLCPSQTELLYALGLGDRVVGRTQWCIHPAGQVTRAVTVGGTKKVNLRKVAALAPDLILCEKEENTPEMVAELQARWPVYVTQVESVADALRMIRDVGAVCGADQAALRLVAQILQAWNELKLRCQALEPIRVGYFIWREPWMAAGGHTYINDVLGYLNLTNVFADEPNRYPQFQLTELPQFDPQVLLFSSEPYNFSEKDFEAVQPYSPNSGLLLADGEAFSWYGVRMLPSVTYLQILRHNMQPPAVLYSGKS